MTRGGPVLPIKSARFSPDAERGGDLPQGGTDYSVISQP